MIAFPEEPEGRGRVFSRTPEAKGKEVLEDLVTTLIMEDKQNRGEGARKRESGE